MAVVPSFQSTHPHGVRQNDYYFEVVRVGVSIHAPTRGATVRRGLFEYRAKFQSTHPHGVRRKIFRNTKVVVSFNPRTHTGCDMRVRDIDFVISVSIHAPTRGATVISSVRGQRSKVSIHAPTRGATNHRGGQYRDIWGFNPRTHTGCDLYLFCLLSRVLCFNPRTHTGCDSDV